MNPLDAIDDRIKQEAHAQQIRDARQAQEFTQKNPELVKFMQLMELAREAKPSWHGQQSAASRNTFAAPHNTPKVLAHQNEKHGRRHPSRSGVEGGSITFVVCKDNGDGTFTQGKVTADATFVADA